MKRKLSYQEVKNEFSRSDWDADQISKSLLDLEEKDDSIKYIIEQIKSKEISRRYIASLMIIQYNINEAVETLIKRILDKETLNSNGTMTFALKELDCKNHLVEIFSILSSQSYESKCHAYNILCEQEFVFTKNDLDEMKNILELAIQNKSINQIFDEETLEMVIDGYKGFEKYLIESKDE